MSRTRNPVIEKKRDGANLLILIIVVVLIAMIGLTIFATKEVRERKKKSDNQDNSEKWTLPATPITLGPPNLPPIPQLLGVARSQAKDAIAGYDNGSLTLKLKAVIESHPLAIIREELHRKLESGEIFLNFQPAQGALAQFQAAPSVATEAVHLKKGVEIKPINPTLTLDPVWLAELSKPDQIILAFLVLYHEYIHFQQFEMGDEKIKLYFSAAFLTESQRLEERIDQAQSCRHMWMTELEAYAKECRIANQWGTDVLGDFCLYVDSALWMQAVFLMFSNNESLDPKFRLACARVFAQLAGHPHPELFNL